jgi:hypothetical protein
LEAKLVIIDKKKEVKIEKVEATREEARNKAKLEEDEDQYEESQSNAGAIGRREEDHNDVHK